MTVQKKTYDDCYLRGYCRVCNRYYFFKHQMSTENIQFHQHHSGICQGCGYVCARIKPKQGRRFPEPDEK